jgi:hypothetical protein
MLNNFSSLNGLAKQGAGGATSRERVQGANRASTKSSRILVRPKAGFYVARLAPGKPLVPALIFQLCPMVVPQPRIVGGPHPDDWCRPLARSPTLRAQINGRAIPIDRVWTARSLQPVSATEYAFRIGPLREWTRSNSRLREAPPWKPVDLTSLPSLF